MTQSTDCERGEYGQNGLYGLYGLRALGCEGAKRPGKFKSARHTGCHALCPTCPTARLTVSALRNVPCQPTEYTAMRYKNSKAHGTHCTMCPSSVHIRTHPYLSVRHCSQYRLCAMCPASQQTTQPCAFEISQHMAHTAPSANRPTSPTSPTSPTFFAHSIGSASVFASQRRGKLFALPAQSPFFLLKKTLPDL